MKQAICKTGSKGDVILRGAFMAVGITAYSAACLAGDEARSPAAAAEPVPATTSRVKPFTVPTFHCLGVFWSPEEGGAGKNGVWR